MFPTSLRPIRIFVSSPSDCSQERQILEQVADDINRSDSRRTGLILQTFKWEDDVVPRIGPPPQTVIDEQTPACDIYLGIMSSRFGGEDTRESGTLQEFRHALERFRVTAQPWVLFYFNDAVPPPKTLAESRQFTRVLEFKEELEKLGIVGTYSGVSGDHTGFYARVNLHLRQLIQRTELTATATSVSTPAAAAVSSMSSGIGAASLDVALPRIAAPPMTLGLQPVFRLDHVPQPRPRMEELFEVISDPDEIFKALFRTEARSAISPYDVDYVGDRDEMPDVQQQLGKALREAGGRLLVCGRAGIGKTREVAELGRDLCARDWKICVARSEGDNRLGPLAAMPAELLDSRLLLIVDNLHARILDDREKPSYMERLQALLDYLELHAPDCVRLIAVTRDEPHFVRNLSLPREDTRWQGFGLFRLPDLTVAGLQQILTRLAARANVPVAPDAVPRLVEDSDRKPRTLFINVYVASRKKTPLTAREWSPTGGESWRNSFSAARAKYPAVDQVLHALRLLTAAGLPTHSTYVESLAGALSCVDPAGAIEALLDGGLLGLRKGVLTVFSAEPLES